MDIFKFFTGIPDVTNLRSLQKLAAALNPQWGATEIANPDFQAIKSWASSAVEDVTRQLYKTGLNPGHGNAGFMEFYAVTDLQAMYVHEVPGKLKKLKTLKVSSDAGKAAVAWLQPRLEAFLPIAVEVERLKGCVVKRTAKPKVDDTEKYVAPMMSKDSGKLLLTALTNITTRLYAEFEQAVFEYYVDMAERAMADYLGNRGPREVKLPHELHVFERENNSFKSPYRLVANYRDVLAKQAKRDAKDMQDAFIVKNAKKLGAILDGKQVALVGEPLILSADVMRGGRFQGTMRVSFVDGSSFDVQNQMVIKYSVHGKMFAQYPTTFHNVKMADGSKMGQPSEERMNTVFVGK